MGNYADRTHFQDKVTGCWSKFPLLLSALGWALTGLGDYGWLALGIACGLAAWQGAHAGVWTGDDDVLIVHPVWGRRRVSWADIDRFTVRPFNQWMIVWVVTQSGDEIPCQGISSGRRRTHRVDVVVQKLNALLHARVDGVDPGGVTSQP